MNESAVMDWLLSGDVSIQYQTRAYLLGEPEEDLLPLRRRIAEEGWGKMLLDARNASGHWGRGFYQVKWVSSHYTLLDLRYLETQPLAPITSTLQLILDTCRACDGSISESRMRTPGDMCVNGMFLNYAAFFRTAEGKLAPVVDYILDGSLDDGGFNCESLRRKVRHSSMHTTISVLEGIREYLKAGYTYRAEELKKSRECAEEFLLVHRLFRSDKTGNIIDPRWLMLSFPSRWHYDILRALAYFADASLPYDSRMEEALDVLVSKRRKDGTWPIQAKHPGAVHFDMEQPGNSSRWNTLRALRVLKAYRG